jgi:hypothetical protein
VGEGAIGVGEKDVAMGEEDAGVGEGAATGQGGRHVRREGREARETRGEQMDGEQRHGMGCAVRRSLASRAGVCRRRERGVVGMSGWYDERIRPWRVVWRWTHGRRRPPLYYLPRLERRTFESEHYRST